MSATRTPPSEMLHEDVIGPEATEAAETEAEASENDILSETVEGRMIEARIRRRRKKRGLCAVSGTMVPVKELFPIAMLRPRLIERLLAERDDLTMEDRISLKELNKLRARYVVNLLQGERGELSSLEQEVVESLEKHETLAEDTEREWEGHRTFGERMADIVASFGGSWVFIIAFFLFLAIWMGINLAMGEKDAFDVYPFILLNLVLSCLAAIQAPIIMMSQKRQESKDRLRSQNDYRVNLKAELEIRHLHEKVDHLLNKQWERLAEIQEIQLELLHEIAIFRRPVKKKSKAKSKPAKPAVAETPGA